MFEVGKSYSIGTDDGDGVGYQHWKVVAIDGVLIKVENGIGHGMIINTQSRAFVSAQHVDHDATLNMAILIQGLDDDDKAL